MSEDQARHGRGRYGYTTYGISRRQYAGFEAPWYIQTRTEGIRIDGLSSPSALSPVVPGQTVTYECVFLPQPERGDPADDHVERFTTARDLLVRAPDVVTFDPPGTTASYREQHGDADGTQLVAIGPLAPASDASSPDAELPPSRDSIHEPRWAVVTGGEAVASLPETHARLTLEATTIASIEDFATRDAVRAARENNGF
jgi:hypothetical protein